MVVTVGGKGFIFLKTYLAWETGKLSNGDSKHILLFGQQKWGTDTERDWYSLSKLNQYI